jgi:hypothetical protein
MEPENFFKQISSDDTVTEPGLEIAALDIVRK